ncbi:MAG: protein phosphatase 2C domain-containing protein [Leptolyngbyaceae cyanobacterium bins.349]|nr:protein phosphatase 2C domain-containing protein [Leptolyngbyaceae cyanobacterium bins.349]
MHRPEITLYCGNPLCQAPNPASHRFCQNCRAPLSKHYLWLVSQRDESYEPGTVLVDRYVCQHDRVFLDTKPALLPEFPENVSEDVEPYLRLIAAQPQVPQVYAVLPSGPGAGERYLLEKAPIYPFGVGNAAAGVLEGTLMPEITAVWSTASGLRQLNWLWQLAQLWESCVQEGVGQSLVNPPLLRIEGGMVRLLELHRSEMPPRLAHLGHLWQSWVATAHADVADFLAQLCHQLLSEQIQTSEHLVDILDQAIAVAGQGYHYQIQIATLTDQGPTRQRNEDACFPVSGSVQMFPSTAAKSAASVDLPYAIVCDGIGGHEGGNIASNLAIATLQQHLQMFVQAPAKDANTLMLELEEATLAANDAITQRNDDEQRHQRQRMGTTLVMALERAHELYITHVGDSRAYRITSLNCHQVTLDDDLAAREVRLGYALYREALRQPSAGSLVQALGMNTSSLLRPNVQRFLLDEDCVFLLCSDGLSDQDRVDQYWQTYILPLLAGSVDIATVAQQLIALANQQNGHDNVTVAVVLCRVSPSASAALPVSDAIAKHPASPHGDTGLRGTAIAPSTLKTKHLKPPSSAQANRPWWPGLLLLLGIGGLISYFFVTNSGFLQPAPLSSVPSPAAPDPTAVPTTPPISMQPPPAASFAVGTRMLVNRATPAGAGIAPIALLPRPIANPSPTLSRSQVPVGSVLEVMQQRQDELNQRWLGVKVCSATAGHSGNEIAEPGELGWVQESAIAPFVTANVSLTPAQLGTCAERRTGSNQPPNPRQEQPPN